MLNDYLIKGIDHELWKEFKAACAHYEISMREIFVKQIENVVNDYRIYKMNFGEPETKKLEKGKR